MEEIKKDEEVDKQKHFESSKVETKDTSTTTMIEATYGEEVTVEAATKSREVSEVETNVITTYITAEASTKDGGVSKVETHGNSNNTKGNATYKNSIINLNNDDFTYIISDGDSNIY